MSEETLTYGEGKPLLTKLEIDCYGSALDKIQGLFFDGKFAKKSNDHAKAASLFSDCVNLLFGGSVNVGSDLNSAKAYYEDVYNKRGKK